MVPVASFKPSICSTAHRARVANLRIVLEWSTNRCDSPITTVRAATSARRSPRVRACATGAYRFVSKTGMTVYYDSGRAVDHEQNRDHVRFTDESSTRASATGWRRDEHRFAPNGAQRHIERLAERIREERVGRAHVSRRNVAQGALGFLGRGFPRRGPAWPGGATLQGAFSTRFRSRGAALFCCTNAKPLGAAPSANRPRPRLTDDVAHVLATASLTFNLPPSAPRPR